MPAGDPRLESLEPALLLLEEVLEDVFGAFLEAFVEGFGAELDEGVGLGLVLKTHVAAGPR